MKKRLVKPQAQVNTDKVYLYDQELIYGCPDGGCPGAGNYRCPINELCFCGL